MPKSKNVVEKMAAVACIKLNAAACRTLNATRRNNSAPGLHYEALLGSLHHPNLTGSILLFGLGDDKPRLYVNGIVSLHFTLPVAVSNRQADHYSGLPHGS